MSVRVDPEFVKQSFASKGFTLLDPYDRASAKMRYRCAHGHEQLVSWAHFRAVEKQKSGSYRCPQCSGYRHNTESVRAALAKEGYTLLNEYSGAHSLLKYRCPQKHEHQISWSSFQQGHRCAYCDGQIVTHADVDRHFASRGYKLLSRYENNTAPLSFLCPSGHTHRISWCAFNAGQSCARCAQKIMPTQDEIFEAFQKKGFTLLTFCKSSTQYLRYICPEGHMHCMTWNSFKNGMGCGKCSSRMFDKSKPAILYYVRIEAKGHSVYKIGVTNKTVSQRFRDEGVRPTSIKTWLFRNGATCLRAEKMLLKGGKSYAFSGPQLLNKTKNTEMFSLDILGLDPYQRDEK